MIKRATSLLFLALSISTLGCTKTKVTRAPGGVLRLECARGMKDCVAQAEKQCNVQKKDGGYVILTGESRKVLMGSKDGQYRTAAEVAELEVRCGAAPTDGVRPPQGTQLKLPPRTDTEVAPSDLVAITTLSKPVTSCTKGSTQACIGPGACQGGQACLADGSGYGPCDCGTSQAVSPAAPAPAPSAPSPQPAPAAPSPPPAPAAPAAPPAKMKPATPPAQAPVLPPAGGAVPLAPATKGPGG